MRLSWLQKVNNKLNRTWQKTIDSSKCSTAQAVAKRDSYSHGTKEAFPEYKWKKVYALLMGNYASNTIDITYREGYQWDPEDYQKAYEEEREYYGTYAQYPIITIYTPKGRIKKVINLLYV